MSASPLRIVRVMPASAEEVFDAWVDPESLAVWMAPGSVVRSVVEVDARVGGRFRILMKGPDCDHEHAGEYRVLERPRRLVFTWASEATGGRSTTVSVEIRPLGPGESELTLTHEGLPDEAATARHRSGWGDILRNLGEALRARGGRGAGAGGGGVMHEKRAGTTGHPVVSREAWLGARTALLAKEKEFSRLRDELSRQRRALPWVKVEKQYVFEGPAGKETLSDLFQGRSQLVIYHFMFHPDSNEGCKHCSFWADSFDGNDVHLAHRDVSFLVVSRAPLAKLQAFQRRMGWSFKWVSSFATDFNHDYHVSFTPDQVAGEAVYNYVKGKVMPEREGLSVFCKDAAGDVFHSYSCYARGIDLLNTAYNILDLVPKGRDEEGEGPQAWVRHHDRYQD